MTKRPPLDVRERRPWEHGVVHGRLGNISLAVTSQRSRRNRPTDSEFERSPDSLHAVSTGASQGIVCRLTGTCVRQLSTRLVDCVGTKCALWSARCVTIACDTCAPYSHFVYRLTEGRCGGAWTVATDRIQILCKRFFPYGVATVKENDDCKICANFDIESAYKIITVLEPAILEQVFVARRT